MNIGIVIKGPAQHNPFIVFALVGHFTLFFILIRIDEIVLLALTRNTINVNPKVAVQIAI